MERRLQLAIGGVLVAAGLGAGGYILEQYLRGRIGSAYLRGVTTAANPPEPLSPGVQEMTLTIAWANPTGQPVTYGVQAATLQDGLVAGHWWSSLETAREAARRYQQGDIDGSQRTAADPMLRVPAVTVGPGQQGQIRLYEVVNIQPGEEWHIWIQPAEGGQLLVADVLGQHVANPPQAVVKVQVKPA
ncbi:MAG TPA: hypothetical protein VGK74_22255 [Symbiobacteriaceae bacterium]|jgi:hypothetical protein